MNVNALKKRLGEISNTNKKNNSLWKPKAGKQQVRLVPNKHSPDNPFIELFFHYDLNGKTYISPMSFDRPDPIVEFCNELKKTGDKDDWKLGNKMMPKMRVYAPVVVREEESEGVRFWGFGKLVYQALLGIISDDDYGDITDMKEGHDITVEFLPAKEINKQFPETNILARPKKTEVGDSSIVDAIKNQSDVTSIWQEPTYDFLKNEFASFMNPEGEQDVADEIASEVAEVSKDASTTETSKAPVEKSGGTEDEFDKLFNS